MRRSKASFRIALYNVFLTFPALAGLFAAGIAHAAVVTWSPLRPNPGEEIRIELTESGQQAAILHWGVNAAGQTWQRPAEDMLPDGSVFKGIAARTPFEGPDAEGTYQVMLTTPTDSVANVASIDFAVEFEDGTWENRGGQDYHIPLTPERVAISPAAPSIHDRITVTIRRSKPGGRLRWGVNAREDDWTAPHPFYRPGGSRPVGHGEAIETPLPDPDENGESVLLLGPFDQGYQHVLSLHAVARWDDEWDSNFGNNYNFLITTPKPNGGLSLRIIKPEPDEELRERCRVVVDAEQADEVTLWLDGRPLPPRASGEALEWNVSDEDVTWGPHELVARAATGSNVVLQSVDFWRHPPEVPKGDPPSLLDPGVTLHDDGTVSFSLFAPGLKFVTLVGDFNAWDPQADPMRLSEGGTWWLRRPVPPGEHQYQYVINGGHRIADPYSTEVQWLDDEGREASDSALAKSVFGVTSGDPERVNKSGQDYQRPAREQLIIYEFHIQDFSLNGGFRGVEERLDYVRDLGVTAIEPLPVYAFPGDKSWGYNPAFHFAPESSYGSPEDLQRLVAAAHARGMAVIMDMVFNHMDRASALWQLYRYDYDGSPYFRSFDGPNWGFPDIDQRDEVLKAYIARVLEHWLTVYQVDGFRYDATRWVEWEGYNDWGASWFAYAAKQVDDGSFQIAEHLPSEPPLIKDTEMDMEWDAHFRWRIREMLVRALIEDPEELHKVLDPTIGPYTNGFQRMAYLESHDESRFLAELLDAGFEEEEALRRVKAGLAVLLTVPGVPMLYSGQEFGEITPKVVGPNPLQWERLKDPRYSALHDYTRAFVHLRAAHPALTRDGVEMLLNDAKRGVFAYQRGTGQDAVVVAVNVSREDRDISLPLPSSGSYRLFPFGNDRPAKDGTEQLHLRPGEAQVFVGSRSHPALEDEALDPAKRSEDGFPVIVHQM